MRVFSHIVSARASVRKAVQWQRVVSCPLLPSQWATQYGLPKHFDDTNPLSSNARPSLLLHAVEKEPEDEVQLAGDDRMERPARKKMDLGLKPGYSPSIWIA